MTAWRHCPNCKQPADVNAVCDCGCWVPDELLGEQMPSGGYWQMALPKPFDIAKVLGTPKEQAKRALTVLHERNKYRQLAGQLALQLDQVVRVHHNTLAPSRLHDPTTQRMDECATRTCRKSRELLREAEQALEIQLPMTTEALDDLREAGS